MKKIRRQPFHVWVSCLVLLCFALAKLGTIFAREIGFLPNLLHAQDSSAKLMLVTGIAELLCVVIIICFLSAKRACQLIALVGLSFLTYRFFMFNVPCPCMGAAPELIPWLKLNERIILVTVPFGLLLLGLWGWAREVNLSSRQIQLHV